MANTNTAKNVFINFISDKMLHLQTNKSDGRNFYSVSIACPASANKFGTIAVTEKQVFAATKNKGTEVVDGFKNVLLGRPDKMRKVSILNADSTYGTVEMSNADILKAFDAEREAYKAQAQVPAQA